MIQLFDPVVFGLGGTQHIMRKHCKKEIPYDSQETKTRKKSDPQIPDNRQKHLPDHLNSFTRPYLLKLPPPSNNVG